MRLNFYFIFFFLKTVPLVAARNLPSFISREKILEIKLAFPSDLPFFYNKAMSKETNDDIARPFKIDKYLVINSRYSIDRQPFVSIILLSYYVAYTKDLFNLSNDALKKDNITLISHEKKFLGTQGELYLVEEKGVYHSSSFLKWVALFNQSNQTVVVMAVFPSELKENWSDRLRRIVEYAEFIPE